MDVGVQNIVVLIRTWFSRPPRQSSSLPVQIHNVAERLA